MFDYKSTTEIDSTSRPGVKLTLYSPTNELRDKLMLSAAEILKKLASISIEAGSLENKEDPESQARVQELVFESTVAHKAIDKLYFKMCVKAVDGMTIEGEVPDGERLFQAGPPDLVSETSAIIKQYLGLTGAEQKN